MDLKQVAGRLTGRPMAPTTHIAWLARSFGRRELAPLRPGDVAALAEVLEAVEVSAGQKVVGLGDDADAAYIVEVGEIELFTRRGDHRSLVSIQRTGGVFGDVPLLCEMAFPFDAIARSDSRLLVVRSAQLVDLLGTHPAIGVRWLSSAVRRLEHANRRLALLTTSGVTDRVSALLADEVANLPPYDDGPAIVDLTQAELAALLGASREAVNRALKNLADEDLLRTEYGQVVVTDVDAMVERGGRNFPVAKSC